MKGLRMIRIALAFAFAAFGAFLLAGCSGNEKEPPVAHGGWQPLAPGLWDIDPARVTVPPMPGE